MSKRKVTKAAPTTILHELNAHGQHRIVRLQDGKAQYGDWAAHTVVAKLDALRAATSYFADSLPQGVFTTTSREHTVL